jgi:hypothetical protein
MEYHTTDISEVVFHTFPSGAREFKGWREGRGNFDFLFAWGLQVNKKCVRKPEICANIHPYIPDIHTYIQDCVCIFIF